jgi:hypothetical protein
MRAVKAFGLASAGLFMATAPALASDLSAVSQWANQAQAHVENAVDRVGLPMADGEFRVVKARAVVAPDGRILSAEPVGDKRAAETRLVEVLLAMKALPALPAGTTQAQAVRFEILAGQPTLYSALP